MAKWVRNWQTPYTADGWGGHHNTMMIKELCLVAGYTVDSDDGDSAWTSASNILVNEPGGANGFQVSAGSPREIYDPLGRFTQAMVDDECSIGLRGGVLDDDQNHSLWRIVEYLDANHVRVDSDGFNPFGWVTDTQLAGRIFKFSGLQLTSGAWVILDSPDPERVQIKVEKDSTTNCYVQIAPFGKPHQGTAQAGDTIGGTAPDMTLNIAAAKFNKHMVGLNVTISGAPTPANNGTFPITAVGSTGQITYTNASGSVEGITGATFSVQEISTLVPSTPINCGDYYTNRLRVNAYIDDGSFILYTMNQDADPDPGADTDFMSLVVGKLTGTDDGDTDPWCVAGGIAVVDPYNWYLYGLNGAATPAQISHWITYPQQHTVKTRTTAYHTLFGRRVNVLGKTPLRVPYIVMDDTASVGACIRGRLSLLRVGYNGFETLRPLDSAGTLLHWKNGMFVPRNGPNDPLPLLPPVS